MVLLIDFFGVFEAVMSIPCFCFSPPPHFSSPVFVAIFFLSVGFRQTVD